MSDKNLSEKEGNEILQKMSEKLDIPQIDGNIKNDFPKPIRAIMNAIGELWFIYGNHGTHHTFGNHRFVQRIYDRNTYELAFVEKYPEDKRATDRCKRAMDSLLVLLDKELEMEGSSDVE